MSHPEPVPVTGVTELALLCSDRRELRECTEFYCETLGFPLVTVWQRRDGSNYGRPVSDVESIEVGDVKGEHEVWFKAGRTHIGLWLPRTVPSAAERPPSEWEDIWDRPGEHVHFALEVRPGEFDDLLESLADRDVEHKLVEHPDYGAARSVFVRDPANHVLEFAEAALRAASEGSMPN